VVSPWAQVVSSISGVMDYDGLVRCEFRIPRLWKPEVFFGILTWVWINTYENTIFNGMNIHLPAILM